MNLLVATDSVLLPSGGVRVDSFLYSPLIPSSLQGTSYDGIMHVSDWFPTVLDLAGVHYKAKEGYELDGVNQKDGWVKGSDYNRREYLLYNIYYNVHGEKFSVDSNAPLAIRNSQYKLIHAFSDTGTTSGWYRWAHSSKYF